MNPIAPSSGNNSVGSVAPVHSAMAKAIANGEAPAAKSKADPTGPAKTNIRLTAGDPEDAPFGVKK